jgi:hypothetical protein
MLEAPMENCGAMVTMVGTCAEGPDDWVGGALIAGVDVTAFPDTVPPREIPKTLAIIAASDSVLSEETGGVAIGFGLCIIAVDCRETTGFGLVEMIRVGFAGTVGFGFELGGTIGFGFDTGCTELGAGFVVTGVSCGWLDATDSGAACTAERLADCDSVRAVGTTLGVSLAGVEAGTELIGQLPGLKHAAMLTVTAVETVKSVARPRIDGAAE